VTAAAYIYADGGEMSPEIRLLGYIDRFGVEAVMGRPFLTAKEIRCLVHAENLVQGYRERERAKNAAEWVKNNPTMHKLLRQAELLANGE